DGNLFTIEGIGMGLDSTNDETHFTYQSLMGDGAITLRFVPQPSSQFSKMGLMIREGLVTDAPHVSLLIYPGKSGQIEAPNWHVRLLTRNAAGEKSEMKYASSVLAEPVVTFGRLTGYYWLRLQRRGNVFSGYTSYDGKTWMEAGNVSVPLNQNTFIGFSVASGMPNSTTIFFDNV